nr:MAG TPA: hypothetical protein [Bacteriophage sp.]
MRCKSSPTYSAKIFLFECRRSMFWLKMSCR